MQTCPESQTEAIEVDKIMIFVGFLFLPFFYHLPVNSLIFTNLLVNLKAGKSSTLVVMTIAGVWHLI